MAIRGENIGTAYVRILADGTGFDRSVRDQMDDVDWNSMGRKPSREFTEGWEEEMEKAPNRDRLRDSIAGPLVKGEWLTNTFFRSKNWSDFRAGLEKEYGEAGKRAGQNLETQLFEGMDFDQLDRKLKNLTPIIVAAQKQIDKEILEEQARLEKERSDLIAQGLSERTERERRAQRESLVNTVNNERLRRRQIGITRSAYADLMELIERMNRGEEEAKHNRSNLLSQLKNLRLEMDRLGIATHTTNDRFRDNEERLFRMTPTLSRFTRKMDDVGVAVGHAFGKGSRNDFINFTGVVAGGISRIALTAIPRGIAAFTSYIGKLRLVASQGKSVLGQLGADIGKVIGGLGGAVGGLFLIVGPVVSIFSQLLGAAMALVSTISLGLVGAVGALGGALLPLGAGIAATILGFKNLDGEAKKAAKGVVNAFKDLGEDAAAGLTFDRTQFEDDHNHVVLSFETMMNRIRKKVDQLGPIMQQAGRGVADAMNIALTKGGAFAKGGAWDKFVRAMGEGGDELGWIGTQTRKMGRIFSETFGGLLGVFRGLKPITNDFLSWARDLSVEFRRWANSPQGIRDMRAFMDRAADSASELGGFLAAVRDLFFTLVDAGSESGDSLFSSMTNSLNEWNDSLKADGGKNLREWFSDSVRFARRLGDAFVELLELFQDLDTQASREIATFAFEALAQVLETIQAVLGPVVRLFDGLNKATGGASGAIAAAALIFPRFNTAIGNMQTKTQNMVGTMRNAQSRMDAFKGAARSAAGAAGLALFTAGTQQSEKGLSILMQTAGGAAAGFALGGPVGAAIGGLAGGLLGIAQNARRGESRISDFGTVIHDLSAPTKRAEENISTLKDSLDQLTGATTQATRALVLQELQEQGLISAGEKLGLTQREMIDAAMGDADVRGRLNPLYKETRDRIDEIRVAQGKAATMGKTGEFERLQKEKEALQEKLILLNRMPGELAEMGKETRAAARATQDLTDLQGKIRPKILTKIEATGVTPTARGIANVVDKYDLLPKEVKSLVSVVNPEIPIKAVQRIIDKLKESGKQKPKPVVEIDHSPFDRGLDGVNRMLDDAGRRVATPHINVNSNAGSVAAETARQLREINDEIVYIDLQRRGGRAPITATGGLFNYAQTRLIGESGPEAVVPLNRPLGMVDPSVRWLSAIAQGKEPMARGGVVGGSSKTFNVEQHIYAPSADPRAVATEAINHMVATGY